MASILRQLSDEDLEAVHHLMRRDDNSDLEIGREAERRFGKPLWESDLARSRAVSRYRSGRQYQRWLERWTNQDVTLRAELAAQKQRFELLSSLVSGGEEEGLRRIPKALLARVLVASAEMGDEELLNAMKGRGPLATTIRLVRELLEFETKAAAAKAEDVAGDSSLSEVERRRRIREIFRVEKKD